MQICNDVTRCACHHMNMQVCKYKGMYDMCFQLCKHIDLQVKSRQFKLKKISDSTFFGLKIFFGQKFSQTHDFFGP